MCRRVKCDRCGKTTWAGCGAHVDQVMAGVPKSEQCQCAPQSQGAKRSWNTWVVVAIAATFAAYFATRT